MRAAAVRPPLSQDTSPLLGPAFIPPYREEKRERLPRTSAIPTPLSRSPVCSHRSRGEFIVISAASAES